MNTRPASRSRIVGIERHGATPMSVMALLREPHRVELLVQVVARRDGPPLDLRVVRDDPVPLQRVDVVNLLVEQPPLELSDVLLPLLRVDGATLLLVELVERSVDVAAVVRRTPIHRLELVEVEVGLHNVAALEVGRGLESAAP